MHLSLINTNGEAHYEVTAYNAQGERLSLNKDREQPDELTAKTLWDAAAQMVSVPGFAWQHWVDGESERVPVQTVVLQHLRTWDGPRGGKRCEIATLEVVDRGL